MKTSLLLYTAAFGTLMFAQTVAVKSASDLSKPSEGISKELGEAILEELRQIRALLQKQQQTPAAVPETAKVSGAGFAIGKNDAPLTLVEFTDYQSPFCRKFHATVFERLKKEYIDTGKLRFVSRDLPLDFHSNAMAAANASRCAGDQNKFWEMRETLMAHADKLEAEFINDYAKSKGLNMDQFRSCIESGKYLPSIRADVSEAAAAGIQGTPSFVLGKTTKTGVEGQRIIGAQPYEVFEKALTEH